MAKYYLMEKAVQTFLSLDRLAQFSAFASMHSGHRILCTTVNSDRCYTQENYYKGLNIHLGRDFYRSAWRIEDTKIPVSDIRTVYSHIAKTYLGVFYHEFLHIVYTPLSYSANLYNRLNPNFAEFAHYIGNILEDVTIEGMGKILYPSSKPHLEALSEIHTCEAAVQAAAKAIKEEPDNPGTMIAFLMLLRRGYDISTLPEYPLYQDNEDFINWGSYKCVGTTDPELRIRRQIAFAKGLSDILEMKFPSKEAIDRPDLSSLKSESGPSKSMTKTVEDILRNLDAQENDYRNLYDQPKNNPIPSEEDIITENLTEVKAERSSNPRNGSGSSMDCVDLTTEAITTLANDDPVLRYSHIAEKLDRHKNTGGYISSYNKVVTRFNKQIVSVVSEIRKMKAHNNRAINHYQTSGKFDLKGVVKFNNYKYFKKKNAPSPEADLCFSILVDNSGSMIGNKSKLAGEALIILAEALNRLHIPFAVDAFTEGSSCVTIKLKEFKDNYDKVKTNMTLLTDQFNVNALSTFSGNIDEVNLMYIRDILLQQRPKDKVCIVISDGATCGDWRTLRKIAQGMEKSGITVLGIGIYDRNVEKIYDKHVVIKTPQDLQNLGAFLHKYLIQRIFKEV